MLDFMHCEFFKIRITYINNYIFSHTGKLGQSKDALYNYYIVVLIFLLDMERTKDYKNTPIIAL